MTHLQNYKRLHGYSLVTPPTNVYFEALFFNFHNPVLSSHLEVRQAIAIAIDYQALIERNLPLQGGATSNVPIIVRFIIPALIPMLLARSLTRRLPINCWMITAG